MSKLPKYAQHFTKLELMKARLEVFQNESGREGVDFIITTNKGNKHELYLQTINVEEKLSVSILKSALGEPKDNLWVALFLLMGDVERLYLIPSNQLAKPDDYVFFESKQGELLSHLSSWQIKVFPNGMNKLNEYQLANLVKNLI